MGVCIALTCGMTNNLNACDMSVFSNGVTSQGIVNVDWWQMSTKLTKPRDGSRLVAPDGWQCILMSPTAVWGERWFIMDGDGNKVATILCAPRNKQIPQESCNVQIANRWLYYEDFESTVDKVCNILPMAFNGLSRVDLCCDFEMDEEKYRTYTALAKKDAYVKALQESACWWKFIDAGEHGRDEVPNQVNWGGTDSMFKWKVYYKWLELEQAAPEDKKPYIIEQWRQAGFNPKWTWRVEVSITKPNGVARLDGSKVGTWEWYRDKANIFCDLYTDKFVVRRKEGHRDKRNDTILPFLEVDGVRSLRHALPASSRDESDAEKRVVCKLWRELMQPEVQCNQILTDVLRRSLSSLLERASNVWILQRVYGVTMDEIVTALANEHATTECS